MLESIEPNEEADIVPPRRGRNCTTFNPLTDQGGRQKERQRERERETETERGGEQVVLQIPLQFAYPTLLLAWTKRSYSDTL